MRQEAIVSGDTAGAARVINARGKNPILFICEHASNYIPEKYNQLGLKEAALVSHVAWDPGALDVATALAETLDAPLVAGTVSRLVFDCNRPADGVDAIPAESEVFTIPGNANLSPQQRAERITSVFEPFRQAVTAQISTSPTLAALVTIHSFTPVYNGQARDIEIGVLHDTDTRVADALLVRAPNKNVQRNEPYGPSQGVTHTLKEYGIRNGLLNVMLEIRNDLLRTPAQRQHMVGVLSSWLSAAFADLGIALKLSEARCQD